MGKVKAKMLGDIPSEKIIVKQFELFDAAGTREIPLRVSIPLAGDSNLRIHPLTVLRRENADKNYFQAIHGTHYGVEYVSPQEALVHLYTDGDFKINY